MKWIFTEEVPSITESDLSNDQRKVYKEYSRSIAPISSRGRTAYLCGAGLLGLNGVIFDAAVYMNVLPAVFWIFLAGCCTTLGIMFWGFLFIQSSKTHGRIHRRILWFFKKSVPADSLNSQKKKALQAWRTKIKISMHVLGFMLSPIFFVLHITPPTSEYTLSLITAYITLAIIISYMWSQVWIYLYHDTHVQTDRLDIH